MKRILFAIVLCLSFISFLFGCQTGIESEPIPQQSAPPRIPSPSISPSPDTEIITPSKQEPKPVSRQDLYFNLQSASVKLNKAREDYFYKELLFEDSKKAYWDKRYNEAIDAIFSSNMTLDEKLEESLNLSLEFDYDTAPESLIQALRNYQEAERLYEIAKLEYALCEEQYYELP